MSSTAARNLLRRHYDSYGGYSSMMMMTDEDRHEQQNQGNQEKEEQEEELAAARSSSRRAAKTDDSWLQLGIGPSSSSSATPAISPSIELDLLSGKPPTSPRPTMFSSLTPLPSQRLNIGYSRPPSPWAFTTNYLMNMHQVGGTSTSIGASTSLMNMPQLFNYNVQRFPILPPPPPPPMRVLRTPMSSSVWFILKAADNQVKEPFLPQIPKSYLRIKDRRMTVRLLMKYLVNKLGLIDESEVQVSCRGHVLPPFLTLQHVRDRIWCLSGTVAIHQDSPNISHIMTLQYSRSP